MSPRTRKWLVVGAIALVAAGATVGATLLTRTGIGGSTPAALPTQKGAPELDLDLGVRTDPEAVALRRALGALRRRTARAAGAIFARYRSLEARVGSALAAWPDGFDRLAVLVREHPRSSLAQLELGLAFFWQDRFAQAEEAWRKARRLEPDTSYADSRRGLPPPAVLHRAPALLALVRVCRRSSTGLSPPKQLAYLAARAARPGDAHAKLLYGAALQKLGRPVSAEREFAAAAKLAPDDPDAQVAAAVGLFDKSQPVARVLEARPARSDVPEGGHRSLPPRADAALARTGAGGQGAARARRGCRAVAVPRAGPNCCSRRSRPSRLRAVTTPAVEPLLDELAELLRIPSLSADPERAGDVRRAAEWVAGFLRDAGGEAEVVDWEGSPLAVGELRASTGADSAPTVLVYGHFDVQPPDPLDLWESDPFELDVRDGWLYARGIADDKGQLYLLLKAAAGLAAEGTLPVNVRFACDGEEEVGGHSIIDFLADEGRSADAAVIFDADMPARGVPAFYVATRGIVYMHLRVRAGERDLHSGMYGGAALNAMHALSQALPAWPPATAGCRSSCAPGSSRRPRRSSRAGARSILAARCSPTRAPARRIRPRATSSTSARGPSRRST